jgi:ABC-type transporter lipoprotein component MlaA
MHQTACHECDLIHDIPAMPGRAAAVDATAMVFTVVNAVDKRMRMPFRYYGSGSPFEYEQIRLLYTKKRELEIADQNGIHPVDMNKIKVRKITWRTAFQY